MLLVMNLGTPRTVCVPRGPRPLPVQPRPASGVLCMFSDGKRLGELARGSRGIFYFTHFSV